MKSKSLFVLLMVLGLTSINALWAAKPVYDVTGYLYKNPENKSIFIPMNILYQDMLLKKGNYVIDTAFLTQYAKKLPASDLPYILDIECWNVRPNVSDEVANIHINNLILVIKTLKTARPDLKFGYYGELPTRDYVTRFPATGEKLRKWKHANERLKRLAVYVDVICPDLYTHSEDAESWKQYAKDAIKESRMYGKPVMPFIWPEYHDAHVELKGKYIPAEYWREQLKTLDQLADGIIIWGGRDVTVNPHVSKVWNEEDPWWMVTKEFISGKNESNVVSQTVKTDIAKTRELPVTVIQKPITVKAIQAPSKVTVIKQVALPKQEIKTKSVGLKGPNFQFNK
ncbi:hypothetical protein [Sulfuricurvum sp.]|uniref:hypothetical protein n=1 Tax=Sulfuricurvum sp. TaxID=2025608 RepID=UPI0026279A9F|nr:hypothetical protein [Sulfuricurvum sp.]MDD2781646.1 hypothetical protein [Sulfuricurvum sp.]